MVSRLGTVREVSHAFEGGETARRRAFLCALKGVGFRCFGVSLRPREKLSPA
jgi:hypothetical protein